ncbi:YigZ family protein [Alkalicoccus urumqiensis]|uniref:YigZ family protein n=1 Tax=Alkalicoccus urumqiensis TaxID=1548213 RepID=A0A2P6MHA6_ALKUR|nr:YigZ family protein [Alkalicoccus urumqiensis]PRO65676.1 YigZ family protein [Alkalicoccus urumqiensis]
MLTTYETVQPYGEAEIVIQKSRFLAFVKRTETAEDAQAFIAEIKAAHPGANHNCSAYMIGEHDLIQKADDDGEPSGTAGVPMLEVLKKRGLKDTCVLVTRYFGGIKLGGGGLIRAYGSAVSAGLEETGLVRRDLSTVLSATFDYSMLGKVENEVRSSSSYPLKEIAYEENVRLTCWVPAGEEDTFEGWIQDLTSGRASFSRDGVEYLETPVPFKRDKRL